MVIDKKQLSTLVPTVIGKNINLFHTDHFYDKQPFVKGTVESFTGTYLVLKDVEFCVSKTKYPTAMIHTNRIHHLIVVE